MGKGKIQENQTLDTVEIHLPLARMGYSDLYRDKENQYRELDMEDLTFSYQLLNTLDLLVRIVDLSCKSLYIYIDLFFVRILLTFSSNLFSLMFHQFSKQNINVLTSLTNIEKNNDDRREFNALLRVTIAHHS